MNDTTTTPALPYVTNAELDARWAARETVLARLWALLTGTTNGK